LNTIFKYMSFLGMDYFDNPTARVSLIHDLNDPFECELPETVKPLIKRYTMEMNATPHPEGAANITEDDMYDFIESSLRGIGIISFSETYRNLLMWAHYANNHSGICMEIYSDWSQPKVKLEHTNSNSLHSFQRVQYDTKRVDFSEKLKLNLADFNDTLVNLCTMQLTLKSDEWMYEKEHRYIMTFLEADYIKLINGKTIPDETKEIMNKYIAENNIELGKYGYETTNCEELEFFYKSLECDSFMYLKTIPPKKIKSIYLGHRFKVSDIHILKHKISAPDHPLHHVSLYYCTISNSRFELDIKKIY
jgi:hypothetical protein